MKAINFTDQELESMVMMYQDELAEAMQYVEQIRDIIRKLNGKTTKEPQKRGRKPKQAATPPVKNIESKAAKATEIKPKKKTTGDKPAVASLVGSLLRTTPVKGTRPAAKKTAKRKSAALAGPKKPVAKKPAGVLNPVKEQIPSVGSGIAPQA